MHKEPTASVEVRSRRRRRRRRRRNGFFKLYTCSTPSPTTLLAPPLLATRPRLLRPIEPRLAARLDATVAIPQPQSSPDSRPATNAVLSEQWSLFTNRRSVLANPFFG